jgi:hypothetical protein
VVAIKRRIGSLRNLSPPGTEGSFVRWAAKDLLETGADQEITFFPRTVRAHSDAPFSSAVADNQAGTATFFLKGDSRPLSRNSHSPRVKTEVADFDVSVPKEKAVKER